MKPFPTLEIRSRVTFDCDPSLLPPWSQSGFPLYVETVADHQHDGTVRDVVARLRLREKGMRPKVLPVIWKDDSGRFRSALDFASLARCYLNEGYVQTRASLLPTLIPFDYNKLIPFRIRAIILKILGSLTPKKLRSEMSQAYIPSLPIVQILVHLEKKIRASAGDGCDPQLEWWQGSSAIATVTHDVDSDWILKNSFWLDRFLEMEKSLGFKSCWFIVGNAFESASNRRSIQKILDYGNEIGIHGYHHTGNLGILSEAGLEKEFKKLDPLRKDFPAKSFRSPWYGRSPRLLKKMQEYFEIDSSVPEYEFLNGRKAGCLSCRPFLLGRMLEIPVTLPDEAYRYYFRMGPDDFYALLLKNADRIAEIGGVINVVHHPFPHFGANDSMARAYETFLNAIAGRTRIARKSPGEIHAMLKAA